MPVMDLDVYAAAISGAFLDIAQGEPPALLSASRTNVVVATAGGVAFHFPREEAAAERLAMTGLLLPYMRGHVTLAIPAPEWRAAPTSALPWGFWGYRRLPGAPLQPGQINERTVVRLVTDLAIFLSELHQFPPQRARALGVAGPDAWREGCKRLRGDVLPVLRKRLSVSEYPRVRRWWDAFLQDEGSWVFNPTLVHGQLVSEHLLFDSGAAALSGVIGWGHSAVGDPAADFVGLIHSYGGDFAWRVVDAYRGRGLGVDAGFLKRVRRLSALRAFHDVRIAAQSLGEPGAPSLEEAVVQLRAGPILARPSPSAP